MASSKDFSFERPSEAPTFYPTDEEFADPLAYIRKIKPAAETYGICKIKPPSHWAPRFSVDAQKFKFVPRVQKLNELDVISRIKLSFTDKITKFWKLQGTPFKIPVVAQKPLDLYELYQFVHSDEFKNSDLDEHKKWSRFAKRVGSADGTQMKNHYERILQPYDEWKSKLEGQANATSTVEEIPLKLTKKSRKRQMGGRRIVLRKTKSVVIAKDRAKVKDRNCQNCKEKDFEEKLLTCEGCNIRCHIFCLNPALNEVPPTGVWHCSNCIAKRILRPENCEYGFEQAQKEYTLQSFGEMADKFKANYFNLPACRVPLETVEKEFWRIISNVDESVAVEYGADLDAEDFFKNPPTSSPVETDKQNKIGRRLNTNNWNFCVLPTLSGSTFSHLGSNISGMTSPWIYVGMCFSTFCWHNEDHWTYSISYLHRGEPKTWYGVPGSKADDFENAMKSAAPDLFASSPDLLHQLVTIMNPSLLKKANVPVYRIDQKQGEFIITFPRAYHAGFNQGFNFAEAVNFAPADWISKGRDCVLHYSNFKRPCVFSHDELVCSMAAQSEKLDWLIASATLKDMLKLYDLEKEHRQIIFNLGVKITEVVLFENIPDDDRQCAVCNTTLYLSAVSCRHFKSTVPLKLVCLKHFSELGCEECKKNPTGLVLKNRYSLKDLSAMISSLKMKALKYDKWEMSVSNILDSSDMELSYDALCQLVKEAHDNSYPKTNTLQEAEAVFEDIERKSKRSRKSDDEKLNSKLATGEQTVANWTSAELVMPAHE